MTLGENNWQNSTMVWAHFCIIVINKCKYAQKKKKTGKICLDCSQQLSVETRIMGTFMFWAKCFQMLHM